VAVKSLDEVIAEGRLRQVLDLKLTRALAHALRGHIVAVLNERVVSPNEVAKELGMDVAYVSYHFRVLRDDYGLIEETSASERRGSREHFYRAAFDPVTQAIVGARERAEGRGRPEAA
jgi:predicted transcriptional regulator